MIINKRVKFESKGLFSLNIRKGLSVTVLTKVHRFESHARSSISMIFIFYLFIYLFFGAREKHSYYRGTILGRSCELG